MRTSPRSGIARDGRGIDHASIAALSSARGDPMPEPRPVETLERMRRQVRAVRWRRNLHELQRALYQLIAVLGVGAAVLLLLALRVDPARFAPASWTIAVVAVGAVAAIARG